MNGLKLMVVIAVILALNSPLQGRAAPQTVADQIEKPVREAIDLRRKSQDEQEQWRDEKQKRTALFEILQKEQFQLNARREYLLQQKNSMQERITKKYTQLERIEEISDQIRPCLDEVMARLHQFFYDDMPFLVDERLRRMADLDKMMADPEVTVSEKLRKVMEALMVEADYGRTIEVYRETIRIHGMPTLVNIFRLGRIALFYQSLDNRACGFYNVGESVWQPLPGKYLDTVRSAMEIGAKQRPAELLSLPVGRLAGQ